MDKWNRNGEGHADITAGIAIGRVSKEERKIAMENKNMKFKEERMTSYVKRVNNLIAERKLSESTKLMEDGLQYYTNRIIRAMSPYAVEDAGMIVFVLRHFADEIERDSPGAKELGEYLKDNVISPHLEHFVKQKKANRK